MESKIDQFSVKATKVQDAILNAAKAAESKTGLEVKVSTRKTTKTTIEIVCRVSKRE